MLRFFLYVFLIAVVVLLIVGAQQLLTSFGVSGLSDLHCSLFDTVTCSHKTTSWGWCIFAAAQCVIWPTPSYLNYLYCVSCSQETSKDSEWYFNCSCTSRNWTDKICNFLSVLFVSRMPVFPLRGTHCALLAVRYAGNSDNKLGHFNSDRYRAC